MLAKELSCLIEYFEIWYEMSRAHVVANYKISKLNDRLDGFYRELVENSQMCSIK